MTRGDVGINPLDEAAREQDIWYRDHPKTEDRMKKAWKSVISKDADVGERVLTLGTTGGYG